MDKKTLSKMPALSCVESYFLAWGTERFDVSRLYGFSFVPLKRVFSDFAGGASYENYRSVPRIQDTAEDFGVTEHEFFPSPKAPPPGAEEALKRIAAESGESLCLVRVNEKFFSSFRRRAWRDDHYVAVDGSLHWWNEYPLSEGQFERKEFAEAFDGALCIYRAEKSGRPIGNDCERRIREQDFSGIRTDAGLKKFEEAVGVLRVTRRRMAEYFKDRPAIKALWLRDCELLDKLYFDARMRQLRKEESGREFSPGIDEIIRTERRIAEEIK